MNRIQSIDVTRSLVMVVMALDHVRDLLHTPAMTQDPTDLATTTPALFLTRWITHLCAPTFVFLSGTSAYLSLQKRNGKTTRWFLLKRGLVLILLELTVINFAFWFDIQFRTILLQVIFAIGGGLVLLSVISKLPVWWVAILGVIIVAGHGLLPPAPFTDPVARFGWSLLFGVNLFAVSPALTVVVSYPLIPWLGIMLLGYALGPVFYQDSETRQKVLWYLGGIFLALFAMLRLQNSYGDPKRWAVQTDTVFTMLSLLNVSKYPPSLLYTLLMLGLALLVLAAAERSRNALTQWLIVYGKVPMFYYILHWYAVHLLMLAMVFLQGYTGADIPSGPLNFGRPSGAGISLGGVYLVWAGLVLALYPLCRWYGRYKAAHPEIGWLRYV
ncbi:DUF1624 domain-containing protein [Spirosoma montaniterrae]|uniref:Heparan-alpha-glucosaminide N-acetyltransferase catalytic domain-containing protein n=1 Tax=Spirosoma montaniterrae TaxID=1178516 RepID=A0A1P9WVC1_9BACT|nr:heparan-alpha-glucosaminide N-acetyltransferase domain-containing protein [Spirosoma montaniterrae]AQG79303.1 hypothetical protein AWR27_08190 [Spirosoma montaniterrae]